MITDRSDYSLWCIRDLCRYGVGVPLLMQNFESVSLQNLHQILGPVQTSVRATWGRDAWKSSRFRVHYQNPQNSSKNGQCSLWSCELRGDCLELLGCRGRNANSWTPWFLLVLLCWQVPFLIETPLAGDALWLIVNKGAVDTQLSAAWHNTKWYPILSNQKVTTPAFTYLRWRFQKALESGFWTSTMAWRSSPVVEGIRFSVFKSGGMSIGIEEFGWTMTITIATLNNQH